MICFRQYLLILAVFQLQYINSWSDMPTWITPLWEILSGKLARTWSRTEKLVGQVGHLTSCFQPKGVQYAWYFLGMNLGFCYYCRIYQKHISVFKKINVASFVFKSEFFTRLEILDLSTNTFSFIFASAMSFINLL